MRKFGRLMSIVVLMALLIPAYAQATATFYVEHPTSVYVGDQFKVTISLGVDSPSDIPPNLHQVCAYSYCILYNDGLVSLVNPPGGVPNIPCCHPGDPGCTPDNTCNTDADTCIAVPPVNGGFFQDWPRTCEDNCTAPGNPQAYNCCAECSNPICHPPDTNVLFSDIAGINGSGVGSPYPCAPTVPIDPPKLVSTLTFEAHTVGCFSIAQNPNCLSSVTDCESGNETIATLVNIPPAQICVRSRPGIPTFSGFGIALFAIVIAGAFVLISKRARRLLLTLLVCFGLAYGVLYGGSVHAQQCPPECYKADVNHNGYVTSADAFVVLKCVKTNCPYDVSLDVNGDNTIDMDDYQLINDCRKKGCCKLEQ
jgi:hypothetical protein